MSRERAVMGQPKEHFEKLFKETSDRYEVLFKEIGDRYRAARTRVLGILRTVLLLAQHVISGAFRKQGIESFDGAAQASDKI